MSTSAVRAGTKFATYTTNDAPRNHKTPDFDAWVVIFHNKLVNTPYYFEYYYVNADNGMVMGPEIITAFVDKGFKTVKYAGLYGEPGAPIERRF